MRIVYIYKLSNTVNNKVYIGATTNPRDRKSEHFRQIRKKCHFNRNVFEDSKTIPVDKFQFQILEQCNYEERFDRETYWYEQFIANLYNAHTNSINKGFKWKMHKDAVRRKTEKRKGVFTPAMRVAVEKARIANTGRPCHPNALKALRENCGPKHYIYGKRRKNLFKPIICTTTNQKFPSITDAAKYFNFDESCISKVCYGKRKHCKKHHFKFASN